MVSMGAGRGGLRSRLNLQGTQEAPAMWQHSQEGAIVRKAGSEG